ncbi:MAG: NAD-dependent dehydratase [Oceanibulbus sp.]|nr:NAD-dependent dehydratase [Sulfitobacter sp.]
MRILITGASGLIGSAMAKHLSADHKILTLGRRASADFQADLSDPKAIAALELPAIDALVHCAGVVDEDFREAPERAMHMAMFGADALAQKAVSAGATRLVYISSAHVYGPLMGHVDETTPYNPVSNYAIAHFVTEQVFRRQTRAGVAGAALRPCAVFGNLVEPESFRRWSLIPFSFPRDAVVEKKIVIRSTGEQRRNFVGTKDIADCCQKWLESTPSGWTGINPLGALTATVFEFAQICAEMSKTVTGTPCDITRVAPQAPTPGSDFDYNTVSPLSRGNQSLRAVMETLMQNALDQQQGT